MAPLGNAPPWPIGSKLMCGNTHAALFLLAFSSASSFLGELGAATITAKSASFADVSAAIASAHDGDTVIVPAETATWTTTLNITKNITLQGAGAGSTVIIDAVQGMAREQRSENQSGPHITGKQPPRRSSSGLRPSRPAKAPGLRSRIGRNRPSPLISINLTRDLPFRMTGFTFKGSVNKVEKPSKARIQIHGRSHAFRVDHCTFDRLPALNVSISGFLWGVIDHCRFNLAGKQPIQVFHDRWNGGDHGNASWADDSYWGSEKFVFIEDNVFDNNGGKRPIDAYQGARFVVRYNQFRNGGLTLHGTEGQGRGARAVEEYNNIYRNDRPESAGQIRSGSIITHDNQWSNVAKGHVLQVYRQFHGSPHWGRSNGQNPYDDNAPNGSTGYWETGEHTGSNGSTVLVDSSKRWTVNQWYQPGASFIVRNVTRELTRPKNVENPQSFAISNTANTVTCSPLTFYPGNALTFNTGDTYQIWKVIHSLDQPGLGRGDLLRGLPGLPAKWPQQVTDPCYSWNNTALEDGTPRNLASTEPSIKEGRDFFNETPKPGYKPYTYPHPLVTGNPATPRKEEEDQQPTAGAILPSK
jgi:hypothetical protein